MKPGMQNGHGGTGVKVEEPQESQRAQPEVAASSDPMPTPFVFQNKEQKKERLNEKLKTFTGGGILLLAILFVLLMRLIPKPGPAVNRSLLASKNQQKSDDAKQVESKVPITEIAHPDSQIQGAGGVTSEEIARTATKHAGQTQAPNLGGIQPFDSDQWAPPLYQAGMDAQDEAAEDTQSAESKADRDALEKPSLVFVRNSQGNGTAQLERDGAALDPEIPLPAGARLRARLEAAINTAIDTPVLAVIEYTYEREGEIVVPAGSKAIGHLESADRSGYVGVRFDSLLMPDGTTAGIQATATDLQLRPLKGKVEGRHTGKNIAIRSLAGLGEITALAVGRGGLNHPFSEGDLLRARAANNIGQASDEQIGRLAITDHTVVSLPAQTEIYVVLAKPAKAAAGSVETNRTGAEPLGAAQLRQLLQLQKELNQQANPERSQ